MEERPFSKLIINIKGRPPFTYNLYYRPGEIAPHRNSWIMARLKSELTNVVDVRQNFNYRSILVEMGDVNSLKLRNLLRNHRKMALAVCARAGYQLEDCESHSKES